MAVTFNILNMLNTYTYIIYQIVFAFFFAGFLAPSLALVFLLFQNNQPFFNGIVWYYLGSSFSYVVGYFLSKQIGIFRHYFLLVSPLVFMGTLCMIAIASAKLSILHFSSKNKSQKKSKALN